MSDSNPKKRQRNLRVEEFQGEVLVYDLESHNAHCLNGPAAAIWQLCDGTLSVPEIAARIAQDQGTAVDEDLVWRALTELDAASLLDAPLETSALSDPSRRSALTQLGWAAAIPLVLSIAVPEPAYAQSAGPTGIG